MGPRRLFENLEIDWARLSGPALSRSESAPDELPTLRTVLPEHLRSVAALLAIHREAVKREFISDSEAGRVAFLATAARCLRQGRNPAALFRFLVERGYVKSATLEDEDEAYAKFNAYQRREGARTTFLKWKRPAAPKDEGHAEGSFEPEPDSRRRT